MSSCFLTKTRFWFYGEGEIDDNRLKFEAFFNEDEGFAFDVPANEPKTLSSFGSRRWLGAAMAISMIESRSAVKLLGLLFSTDQGQAKVAKKTRRESLGRS